MNPQEYRVKLTMAQKAGRTRSRRVTQNKMIQACIKHKFGADLPADNVSLVTFIRVLMGDGPFSKRMAKHGVKYKYCVAVFKWFEREHMADWVSEGSPGLAQPKRERFSKRNLPGWARIRYEVLVEMGSICSICGASPKTTGATLHVDHIKPYSTHPELALDKSNLRVLCGACNLARSNRPAEGD